MAASESEFSRSSSSSSLALGARLLAFALAAAAAGAAGHSSPPARPHRPGRGWLGVGALIGGFEIDDVAEQNLAFVQLVAPDDDGLEGQRALAQAGDHRLAAGLDALGDGDLALARQQLDRAHLAQIHAHGIVGALGGLGACLGLGGDGRGGDARGRPSSLGLVGGPSGASSASSVSMTLMPMSESIDMVSSICSEETSSEGSTSFSSS